MNRGIVQADGDPAAYPFKEGEEVQVEILTGKVEAEKGMLLVRPSPLQLRTSDKLESFSMIFREGSSCRLDCTSRDSQKE